MTQQPLGGTDSLPVPSLEEIMTLADTWAGASALRDNKDADRVRIHAREVLRSRVSLLVERLRESVAQLAGSRAACATLNARVIEQDDEAEALRVRLRDVEAQRDEARKEAEEWRDATLATEDRLADEGVTLVPMPKPLLPWELPPSTPTEGAENQ